MIYGLDPGTEQSALVFHSHSSIHGHLWANADLLAAIRRGAGAPAGSTLIIEKIEGMGMAVGRETFDTVCWAGRFCEAWEAHGWPVHWMTRRTVKLHLCGSMQAKDANIRRALIDRYGGEPAARKGGALAGIKSHMWSSLALCVTFDELRQADRFDPKMAAAGKDV